MNSVPTRVFDGLVEISDGGWGDAVYRRYYDGGREITKEEFDRLSAERYPNPPETKEQRMERWLREAGCSRSASVWEWNGNCLIATDTKGKPVELPIEMSPRRMTTTFTDSQLRAFVSLIVEECASVCTGPGYEDSMVGAELGLAIRERFKP